MPGWQLDWVMPRPAGADGLPAEAQGGLVVGLARTKSLPIVWGQAALARVLYKVAVGQCRWGSG